jgi:hypothetical protein
VHSNCTIILGGYFSTVVLTMEILDERAEHKKLLTIKLKSIKFMWGLWTMGFFTVAKANSSSEMLTKMADQHNIQLI